MAGPPSFALMILLSVTLSSCAVGGSRDAAEPSPTRDPDLGRKAEVGTAPVAARSSTTAVVPSPVTSSAVGAPPSQPAGTTNTTGTAPNAGTPTTGSNSTGTNAKELARTEDPTGDSIGGPPHADLIALAIGHSGPNMRVTVTLAAPVPTALAPGEVIGLGVDIYTGTNVESDYQLFADGGSDGWTAYLQTPQGFVKYPGTLRIDAERLVFEVPWTAVGAIRDGRATSFLDWSRAAVPTNVSSRDDAPDLGYLLFSR